MHLFLIVINYLISNLNADILKPQLSSTLHVPALKQFEQTLKLEEQELTPSCNSIDRCYKSCDLRTGACPSYSCIASLQIDKDPNVCRGSCFEKTSCNLLVNNCSSSVCLGTVKCRNGLFDCDLYREGDLCLFSNNGHKICGAGIGLSVTIPNDVSINQGLTSHSLSHLNEFFHGGYLPNTINTAFVHMVHPDLSLGPSSGFPIRSYDSFLDQQIWSREFTTFGMAPASNGVCKLSIGGRSYEDYSFTPNIVRRAASIRVILKTPVIYKDSPTIALAYQLKDNRGYTQVDLTGITVSLSIKPVQSNAIAGIMCSLPAVLSGIGSCSYNAPINWFLLNTDVKVQTNITVAYADNAEDTVQSTPLHITFYRIHSYSPLLLPNMMIQIPTYPQYAGDKVSMQVFGSTFDNDLFSWTMTVYYDSTVLTFSTFISSALFSIATVLPSYGRLLISCSGLQRGVNIDQTIGASVSIGTLVFNVVGTATTGVHSNVLSAVVNSMESSESNQYVTNADGVIRDERGIYSTTGQITINAQHYVALFAFVHINELINYSPLKSPWNKSLRS